MWLYHCSKSEDGRDEMNTRVLLDQDHQIPTFSFISDYHIIYFIYTPPLSPVETQSSSPPYNTRMREVRLKVCDWPKIP